MSSVRVFVDLVSKGGGSRRWNPLTTPTEDFSWRRKSVSSLLVEEIPLRKKNFSFLFSTSSFYFPFKKRFSSIEEVVPGGNKRNTSFLFNIPPIPAVVDSLNWRHRVPYYVDYNKAAEDFKQNKKTNPSILSNFISGNTDYYRRYLNDPLSPITAGPPVTFARVAPSGLTTYLRRYLNDPFAESIYMWILPNNLADGFTSQFIFTSRPVWCSFNGLNQFETEGYTLQLIGSTFGVTFIDVNGNIIVPEIGADIRAEIN